MLSRLLPLTTLLIYLASTASAAATPDTYLGCYTEPGPLMKNNTNIYQSDTLCEKTCRTMGTSEYALSNGNECWCGDQMPSTSKQVEDSSCAEPCGGWPQASCGGENAYAIYLVNPYPSSSASKWAYAPTPSPSSSASIPYWPKPSVPSASFSSLPKPSPTSTPMPTVTATPY